MALQLTQDAPPLPENLSRPQSFLPPQPTPLPRRTQMPAGNPAIGQGALTQFGSNTPQLFQGVANALTKQPAGVKGTAPLQGMDPSAFMRFMFQSGLMNPGGVFFSKGGENPMGDLLNRLFNVGKGANPVNPAGQDFLLRLSRGETQFPGGGIPDAPTFGV